MPLPVPRPSVVIREVREGAILFCTATETYFGLNPVGVQVWTLLGSAADETDLVRQLSAEYPDATAEAIRRDVSSLLAELVASGLADGSKPR